MRQRSIDAVKGESPWVSIKTCRMINHDCGRENVHVRDWSSERYASRVKNSRDIGPVADTDQTFCAETKLLAPHSDTYPSSGFVVKLQICLAQIKTSLRELVT